MLYGKWTLQMYEIKGRESNLVYPGGSNLIICALNSRVFSSWSQSDWKEVREILSVRRIQCTVAGLRMERAT